MKNIIKSRLMSDMDMNAVMFAQDKLCMVYYTAEIAVDRNSSVVYEGANQHKRNTQLTQEAKHGNYPVDVRHELIQKGSKAVVNQFDINNVRDKSIKELVNIKYYAIPQTIEMEIACTSDVNLSTLKRKIDNEICSILIDLDYIRTSYTSKLTRQLDVDYAEIFCEFSLENSSVEMD